MHKLLFGMWKLNYKKINKYGAFSEIVEWPDKESIKINKNKIPQ